MGMRKDLTIIDNHNVRGVLAPAGAMSKSVLEDVIDFIELSDRRVVRETKILIRDADRKKSWAPLSSRSRMKSKK